MKGFVQGVGSVLLFLWIFVGIVTCLIAVDNHDGLRCLVPDKPSRIMYYTGMTPFYNLGCYLGQPVGSK